LQRKIGLAAAIVNHLTVSGAIGDNGSLEFLVPPLFACRRSMPPKAVLFDFDGVIAETENHHVAAWQRTVSFMGLQLPDEVAARAAEVDDREFLADVFAAREIPTDHVDEWVARKQTLTVELLRHAPRIYPGAVELVEALRGRARLAVVSGTWRKNIETVLHAAGLDGAFDLIIAKEDVALRKPDPEAYSLALKKLRLSAKSVVAIEDSPSGLSAARDAGIRRIAVGHRRAFGDWIEDATYIDGLKPVAAVLERLGF
jgi:beta-phosphoglucomutase